MNAEVKSIDEVENFEAKQALLPTLSLFTSLGTLLCCALPALLVTLGAGASLASLIAAAPWLVAISKYKAWVFGVSGGLLVVAGILRWQSRNAPCPADPEQAKACMRLRRISGGLYWASLIIWLIGFFFAFLAADLLL